MPSIPRTPMRPVLRIASVVLASLLLPLSASGRTRFIAFGDSITVGFPRHDETCRCEVIPDCQQLCGYPRRLQRLLNEAGVDAGVLNRGVGSEKTPEGLSRIDEVLAEGGQVLLLMEGTNDISRNISPETTLANLDEMAARAARAGFETVHVTVIPRHDRARVDVDNVLNAAFAADLRDLAFTRGRRVVDCFESFSTVPNVFDDLYADLPGDPVGHPNSRGFDLMAEVFFDALMGIDTVPPVLGGVVPANGSVDIAPMTGVRVRLYDFGSGIDTQATDLRINGQPVSYTTAGSGRFQDLFYEPSDAFADEVAVRVASRDRRGNAMDREVSIFSVDEGAPTSCEPDTTTLCIDRAVGDRRFQLTVDWNTAINGGQQGQAIAVPLAPIELRRGGLFTFFDLNNPEILVKVLDGCAINGRFWVFVAPTTSLGYELRVVDTVAARQGASRSEYEYVVSNPDGTEAPPVSDAAAFETCEFAGL